MTLTLEIEEFKQKSLARVAAQNGKEMSEFVTEILYDYLDRVEHNGFMKLSETSFAEWDNEADAVYDKI